VDCSAEGYSSRCLSDVDGWGLGEVNLVRSSGASDSWRGVADRLGALGWVTGEDDGVGSSFGSTGVAGALAGTTGEGRGATLARW
jgi:hypothetical protein